tara:strand:+ start:29170 stop:30312 length:1143 start_codon:yes stop_codon:yes gene_type:complete
MEENPLKLTQEELARYARHISLDEIGIKGQELLKGSSVLCIGTGGLGSPLLTYLAAAGIGRIGIIDFDLVDSSNLQRQIIHGSSWLGKPKIDSARSRILEINPFCIVDIYKVILSKDNALALISKFDIICDCTDNFPSRYLINDACVILGKPNVYGAISKFQGQVTIFNMDSESPNLRDLIPEPPPSNLLESCSEAGVIGVLPGLIGIIQATEVIKIITKIGRNLNGRLLIVDALSMKFKEINLKSNNTNKYIKNLIEYKGYCFNQEVKEQSLQASVKAISISDLKRLIALDINRIILIDVRNYYEHEINKIDSSKCIPLDIIENSSSINELKTLSKNNNIYFYCQSGKRSLEAISRLSLHGIQGININGGLNAWNESLN